MSAAAARVLVVDDEAPLAQLVARYLASDGFETTVVGDGLSAVQRAGAAGGWNAFRRRVGETWEQG